jgi:hypothetical protein
VDAARVAADVVDGLRACRLIGPGDSIVSTWHRRLEYGYPTPWLGRQAEAVSHILRGARERTYSNDVSD